MKKKTLLIALFGALALIAPINVIAKEKAPEVAVVNVYGEGIGNGSSAVLNVTCAAKKADKVTDNDLRREAIRAVLFKGWVDKNKSSNGNASSKHPAITGGADNESLFADYYADFLKDGNLENYANIVPEHRRVVKAGKVYHVSGLVTVNVPALSKKLEKDGMIKSLKSGW